MPETAETLTFDKNDNVCSVCTQIQKKKEIINWDEREKQLDEILSLYRGRNKYDCVVPFSGGKDSVFALWYLVKIKNLKPLVVRYDHNFLRKKVNKNTEKVIKKLGVDFINYKSNFSLIRKVMLESLIRRGDFCWHCHTGVAAFPVNIAIQKKINLIFYGEPSSQYTSHYKYDDIEVLDVEKFNKVFNLGINSNDMFEMIKERYKNDDIKITDFDEFNFPSQRELNTTGVKPLFLGNYLFWNVKEQVKIIKKELDWEEDVVEGIPPEYGYEKIECMMQGVRDYIKYLKRGFGRTAHLTSIDIRENLISREQAESLTKMYDGKKPETLKLFLNLVGLNEEEFNEIVKKHIIHPHSFKEEIVADRNTSNIKITDLDDWAEYIK